MSTPWWFFLIAAGLIVMSGFFSGLNLGPVDAPPHHRGNITTFQQVTCFFIEDGEGEEGGSYAVLRRRSAVLVTRSANCEQRKRL